MKEQNKNALGIKMFRIRILPVFRKKRYVRNDKEFVIN